LVQLSIEKPGRAIERAPDTTNTHKSMKTVIYYFTGTGNSLRVAKGLCEALGDCTIEAIASLQGLPGSTITPSAERVGIVCPVYFGGIPAIVARFLERLDVQDTTYIFAALTLGGHGTSALVLIDRIMEEQHNRGLDAGFLVRMPGNYIRMYSAVTGEKRTALVNEAEDRIKEIANAIRSCRTIPVPGGIVSTLLLRFMYPRFLRTAKEADREMSADDRCTACGTCVEVCPVGNIALEGNRPVWRHACEQCMACIQLCPKEAIQIGKKTKARARYRHPALSIEDMKRQHQRQD
jgi:ferredoxin